MHKVSQNQPHGRHPQHVATLQQLSQLSVVLHALHCAGPALRVQPRLLLYSSSWLTGPHSTSPLERQRCCAYQTFGTTWQPPWRQAP
jgi:hypothetical protein